MINDDWSFRANIARGHLPSGEPLEALYGVGPWTPEPEPEPQVVQCHRCGGQAYELDWNTIDCENCGVVCDDDDAE